MTQTRDSLPHLLCLYSPLLFRPQAPLLFAPSTKMIVKHGLLALINSKT